MLVMVTVAKLSELGRTTVLQRSNWHACVASKVLLEIVRVAPPERVTNEKSRAVGEEEEPIPIPSLAPLMVMEEPAARRPLKATEPSAVKPSRIARARAAEGFMAIVIGPSVELPPEMSRDVVALPTVNVPEGQTQLFAATERPLVSVTVICPPMVHSSVWVAVDATKKAEEAIRQATTRGFMGLMDE